MRKIVVFYVYKVKSQESTHFILKGSKHSFTHLLPSDCTIASMKHATNIITQMLQDCIKTLKKEDTTQKVRFIFEDKFSVQAESSYLYKEDKIYFCQVENLELHIPLSEGEILFFYEAIKDVNQSLKH